MKKEKSIYIDIKEVQKILKKNGFSSSYSYVLKLVRENKIIGEKVGSKWQFERKYIDKLIRENKKPNWFRKLFPQKKKKKEILLPLYFGWGIKVVVDKFEEKVISPFKNKYQFTGVFLLVSIAVVGIVMLLTMNTTIGVTYTWVQTDWDQGATSSYPLHPTYTTGWEYYSSDTSGDIKTSVSGQATFNTVATLPAKSATLPTAKYDAVAVATTSHIYSIGGYYLDGSSDPQYLTEIVQYNPSTDVATTTSIGSLPIELRGHGADIRTTDGKIYIFGGYNNSSSTYNDLVYTFDPSSPSSNATSTGVDIGQGREYAPAVYAANVDKFYIFGGFYLDGSQDDQYLSDIIEYNPSTGATSSIVAGSLPKLKGASAEYYPPDGKIYIFGGYDADAGDYSDTIYVFDPQSASNGASDTGHDLPSKRAYTTATYYDSFGDGVIDRIYIFGGYRLTGDTSVYLDEVVEYTTSGNATANTEVLAKQLKGASAVMDSSDSQIYIFGGFDGSGSAFSDSIYYYKLYYGPLVSSAYNTTDPSSVYSLIQWDETLPSGTTILLQVRSASNDDNSTPGDNADDSPDTYTDWCGPDNGAAGCSTTTYFTDNTGGESIDAMLQDGADDHWLQYRAYFVSDSTNNSPTFASSTVTYVINTEPTVSSVTGSQDSVGDVNVGYTVSDEDESTSTISLFYDLGVTLNGELSDSATTVPVSNATYLPSSGTIEVDDEEMTYTGKSSNDLTGVTRGTNNTLYYKYSHSSGSTVWVKGTTVSGDVGSGISMGSGKAITWTADSDVDGFYAATGTVYIKVSSNDQNAARQIGSATSSSFEFDVKDPVPGTTAAGNTIVDINGNATTSLGAAKVSTTTPTINLSATDDTTLYFMQSVDADFGDDSYEAFTATSTGEISGGCSAETGCERTIYIKVKDSYGNLAGADTTYTATTTLDTNAPAVPGNPFIQDVSNASTSEWRLFITWDKATEADWIRYEIASSTDGVSYGTPYEITDINLNYLLESGLSQGQTYYYKMRSVDDIINNSDWTTAVNMEAGGNPNDAVAPTISSVATGTPTTNSVTITWDTDEVSTSQIVYSTATSVPGGSPTQGVSGYSTSHSVTLTGLNASTTYYFKARSADPSSNSSDSSISSFTTASPDTTGPNISSINTSDLTEDSATITWTTNEGATSFVEYSTSTGFSTGTIQGSFDYSTSHSITLHGLDASTQYYFKVRSTDSSGNESISSENSFSTTASSSDVTAPVISSVATSSLAYNTATIGWSTDEYSNSFVEFGLTTSYGRIYGQDDYVMTHSVSLPQDLSAATTYNYRVRSIDSSGNEGFSDNNTFVTSASPSDTTEPVISNVAIGDPGTTSVTITWDTDEVADSYIGYSESTSTYTHEQGTPAMVTSHSVDVVGLQPDTTYYFQVKSKDPSGNQQLDTGYQFTTDSSGGSTPVISNIQIVDVGSNTAKITWSTNQSSDSFVEYGLDTGYGNTYGQFDSVTSHSVTLNGLLSDATYHFRVRSTNSSDLEAVSDDASFTTEVAADVTPPVISAVSAGSIAYTSATITWTTNEATDNIVLYGTSTSTVTSVAGNNTDSTTSHSVDLSGLSAGTTYYYQVQSRDSSGNVQTDDNSGSYYSLDTTADTSAPTISNLAHPVVDRNSATITWDTSESATSYVEYGTDSGLSGAASTTEVTDLRTEHSVIVSGLSSGTTYYYRANSKDSSDNLATSSISNFTTATASEDTTAPAISNVATSSVSMTGITITWDTDESSNSIVDYGISTSSLGSLGGNVDDATTTHSVSLSGLSANTTYYFQVRSQDIAGNSDPDDNSGSYYTFTTTADTTEPAVSSVSADVSADDAVSIVWTTDEDATTKVYYGTTISYGSETTLDSNYTKIHSVSIGSLNAETTYYYKVESIDAAGNTTVDDNNGSGYSFTTEQAYGVVGRRIYVPVESDTDQSAPSIDNLRIENIARSTADILWNTSESASSLVEYGTTEEYGNIAGDYNPDERDHEVQLTNLFSGTKYYYRVISQDASGNRTVSNQGEFTTETALVDTEGVEVGEQALIEQVVSIFEKLTSPYSFASISNALEEMAQRIISAPTVAGDYPIVTVGQDSVEIRWITDKNSNSLVGYVLDSQYSPGAENPYLITVGDTEEMVTDHRVNITGLSPDTLYHFVIMSNPEVGPGITTEDATFRTNPVRAEIINLRLASRTEDSATFAWDTNILTRSNLEYTNLATGEILTQGEIVFKKAHEFELQNLNHGTSYELVLEVIDEYGNTVTSPTVTFTTSADQVAPEILQVNTDSTLYPGKTTKIQTIISWKSDEPAKGQVFWQEGIAEGVPVQAGLIEEVYGINHISVITKFKPATVYKFWIEAEDAFGNRAQSKSFTVLTPEKTETVFEMIVDNLQETFGWTNMFK